MSKSKSRRERAGEDEEEVAVPCFTPILLPTWSSFSCATTTITSQLTGSGFDPQEALSLDKIREFLIRQEDTIIRCLLERAQYLYNAPTYDAAAAAQSVFSDFQGSLVKFMLRENEKMHSKLGRYTSPDETAFFPDDLEQPVLSGLEKQKVLHPVAARVNVNQEIWKFYFDELLPRLVAKGDDGNYGSTACCDISCLQALSKRIHYGKFVAEAKFQESKEEYTRLIVAKDTEAIMETLTFKKVEAMVLKRVELKAKTYGQEISSDGMAISPGQRIDPSLLVDLYANWVMPITKKVEVEYLLQRLD